MGALPVPAARLFGSVAELEAGLREHAYLPDRGLATALYLALGLDKPLLLEGEAGVGKTEVCMVLAALLVRQLVRLQCYEGIDASQALYEWDYSRQLVAIRAAQLGDQGADVFGREFLVERPLLAAVRAGSGAVLLIDELDRADDEFEAFLLEVLSDWTISIPELGTVRAETPPVVVVTSNRTREVHDALKRRCLYHWLPHPGVEREVAIIRRRLPDVTEALAQGVARVAALARDEDLLKPPGVAESLDWAQALCLLGARALSPRELDIATSCLGAFVKYREDQDRVTARLAEWAADG